MLDPGTDNWATTRLMMTGLATSSALQIEKKHIDKLDVFLSLASVVGFTVLLPIVNGTVLTTVRIIQMQKGYFHLLFEEELDLWRCNVSNSNILFSVKMIYFFHTACLFCLLTRTHARTCARAHARTHTHTHTHTHLHACTMVLHL